MELAKDPFLDQLSIELECKGVKNIDPVRISQVTPDNRDSFFFVWTNLSSFFILLMLSTVRGRTGAKLKQNS
jgi:hypothetical protein